MDRPPKSGAVARHSSFRDAQLLGGTVEYNLPSYSRCCDIAGEDVTMSVAQESSQDIRLYTGEYCPYCRRVSKELDRLGLQYESVNADADGREEVVRLSRQRAIPILTIGDEVLVDSTNIIRELRRRYA